MIKNYILNDIADRAMFKLAALSEKVAAGKGGISNPMGGASTSTAAKPVKAAPIMSAAPINDLMPKATTAMTAGLPNLMTNMNQATQQSTQSGVMNNAVLPWNNKSGEYNLEKDAGALLRNLGNVARRNMTRTKAGTIPSDSQLPKMGWDPVKSAVKPVADPVFNNVVFPAMQGYIGSGTAQGPIAKAVKTVANTTSKIPGLKWTGGINKAIDELDYFGKLKVPNNRVARTVNDMGKNLAVYDDYLAAGSAVVPQIATFLGSFF